MTEETKTVPVEIKSRWDGRVLFTAQVDVSIDERWRLRAAVEAAVKAGASLNGASLIGASLDGASLDDASLNRASLIGASLIGASLIGASLIGASLNDASLNGASLIGASLNGASLDGASLDDASLDGASLNGASLNGASLNRASLIGASLIGASLNDASLNGASLNDASLIGASLIGASLNGASGLPTPMPVEAAQRIRAVAQAALASDDALNMNDWHKCETTHCIAGWAIHLAGYAGYTLEKAVGAPMAGLMLLGTEAHAHFYDDNAAAHTWLRSKLEPEKVSP